MGRALADAFPEARARFDEADAALRRAGLSTSVIFEGPEDELVLTENAQPAILTVSVAAYRVLAARGIEPAFVAGHSLGEYSAHVAAGTFAFGDACASSADAALHAGGRAGWRRVRWRPSSASMPTTVRAGVRRGGAGRGRQPGEHQRRRAGRDRRGDRRGAARRRAGKGARRQARDSAGGQRAVPLRADEAGGRAARARAAGARARRPARAGRRQRRRRTEARRARAAIDALVRQVSAPVRWEEVVRRLASEGVTTYVEVGPGTVLSGLVKKIHKDAASFELRQRPTISRLGAGGASHRLRHVRSQRKSSDRHRRVARHRPRRSP